ncbi:ubiquitin carboxyl-terminal hydrolase [Mycotypha africana]|uniref:ubiquitin carboxyl-terminal hydrolase n=1 Tax=Mycotypha africana TaxID=64632 RepID=UPI0022FFE0AA|nr:ubiquitin carboxyl-terminal hydrolase [Mycotypha africana]KAI8988438.1 ubiquitin carboxyl-terminal hydrolase [Mycotypha africana]
MTENLSRISSRKNDYHPWYPMEPNAGTFTELCSTIGAQGVQVEQVHLVSDQNPFHDLEPVHGIMLLVPYNSNTYYSYHQQQQESNHHSSSSSSSSSSSHNSSSNNSSHPIYFAKQMMHDAYALHGLLNILLNGKNNVHIHLNLARFKQLTQYQSSGGKGTTLINTAFLREAYNSLSTKGIKGRHPPAKQHGYQSIVFLKIEGAIWELDGMKENPTLLSACHHDTIHWLDVVYRELLRRYQRLDDSVTLWAVIEDRKLVLQRQIVEKLYLRSAIERRLDFHRPDWRIKMNVIYWDEEFRHTIDNNETSRRGLQTSKQLLSYCQSFSQLPTQHQAESTATLDNYTRNVETMGVAWLKIQDIMLQLYEKLGLEVEKTEKQRMDIQRKAFDYTPFIRSYLKGLYDEGHLPSVLRNYYTQH